MAKPFVWFSTNRMLKAIGMLSNNVYERELLRQIYTEYIGWYYKNKFTGDFVLEMKYINSSGIMGRNTYLKALKELELNGIIKVKGIKGRIGGHLVSIMTPRSVAAIISKTYDINKLVFFYQKHSNSNLTEEDANQFDKELNNFILTNRKKKTN